MDVLSQVNLKQEEKLSLWSKLFFGVGGLPHQMIQNSIALYITPFLLEIAQIRPVQVSIVLFVAKAWDAITDLLVGYLVGKTKYTRFGKRKPWLLGSLPFIIISLILLWFVPSNFSQIERTIWYLIFYCLFQTFNTCFRIPYTSLTMYLTSNEKERTRATGLRMFSEIIGVLLAGGLMAATISLFGINSQQSCDQANLFKMNNQQLANAKSGYLTNAGTMSFIYLVCGCATFFGTNEMQDNTSTEEDFFGSLKACLQHKSFILLLLVFLFNMLTVDVLQTNIALYCKYSIDANDQYQYIIITLLISCALALPIWNIVMQKLGKRLTYAIGICLLIPCLFILLFITKPIVAIYLIAIVAGISMSTNFLLPWSMLPDTIDEFMIKTGTRKEFIFYSLFVFFSKLSSGIAIGLSSAFLELGGYVNCESDCCTQADTVGRTLRLLFSPFPILFTILATICLYFYPIDENASKGKKF